MSSSKPFIDSTASLQALLAQRIVFLDGAMGTMIQRHRLTEKDFRGARFASHPSDVKGNSDLLVLTQPEIITGIHREYFRAGCDIVETNTFGATKIVLAEYGMAPLAARDEPGRRPPGPRRGGHGVKTAGPAALRRGLGGALEQAALACRRT